MQTKQCRNLRVVVQARFHQEYATKCPPKEGHGSHSNACSHCSQTKLRTPFAFAHCSTQPHSHDCLIVSSDLTMPLLNILSIEKTLSHKTTQHLTALMSPTQGQASTHLTLATLLNTASNCHKALETALTSALAEKARLANNIFADPVVQGTFQRASVNGPAFSIRVNDNMDACCALYRAGQRALEVFEEDVRGEWGGVSKLNDDERMEFLLRAREKLGVVVGVQEGLREEEMARTRALEGEIGGLQGRLRELDGREEENVVFVTGREE